MAKKWVPMPEKIRAALDESIKLRYEELMARLAKTDMPNPSVNHEVTADGFKAVVTFHFEKGPNGSSLWEYISRDQRWHMYNDWND